MNKLDQNTLVFALQMIGVGMAIGAALVIGLS